MKRIRNFTAYFDAWALRVKPNKYDFGKRHNVPHFRMSKDALICHDFYMCHYFHKGNHVVLRAGHANRWMGYATKALPSNVIVMDVAQAIPSNCDWRNPPKPRIKSLHDFNLRSLVGTSIRFGMNVRNCITNQADQNNENSIKYFERTINQEIDLLETHVKKTEAYAALFDLKLDWMALPSVDGLRKLLVERVGSMTKTLTDHGPV